MNRALHPRLDPRERRRLFNEGIRLFNHGAFFDCHEAWEEIWRSTTPEPRDLFQGLIQIGVGLYHFTVKKRPWVASRVLAKGITRLHPFTPSSHGLDIATLLADIALWQTWLDHPLGEPPPLPHLRVVDPREVC